MLSYGCIALGDLFSRRRSNHPIAMIFLGLSLLVDLAGFWGVRWWIFFYACDDQGMNSPSTGAECAREWRGRFVGHGTCAIFGSKAQQARTQRQIDIAPPAPLPGRLSQEDAEPLWRLRLCLCAQAPLMRSAQLFA